MNRRIGIVGQMGAGKTSIARIIATIANERNYVYVEKIAQTDPVAGLIKGLNYQGLPKRDAYQKFMEACREIFGEDCWIQLADNNFSGITFESCDATIDIIDDVRQANEVAYLKSKEYITIGVIAPIDARAKRLEERDGYAQTDYMKHSNELQAYMLALEADYVIVNEGTYGELYDKVKAIYAEIMKV